jgi:hypothetical protein
MGNEKKMRQQTSHENEDRLDTNAGLVQIL